MSQGFCKSTMRSRHSANAPYAARTRNAVLPVVSNQVGQQVPCNRGPLHGRKLYCRYIYIYIYIHIMRFICKSRRYLVSKGLAEGTSNTAIMVTQTCSLHVSPQCTTLLHGNADLQACRSGVLLHASASALLSALMQHCPAGGSCTYKGDRSHY